MKALIILKDSLQDGMTTIFDDMTDTEVVIFVNEAVAELEELNNRSCGNCNNNIFNKGGKEYGCNRIEINPSDMKQAGFYCSRFEEKGSR